MRIAYTIEIGSLSISDQAEADGPPLVSLRVGRGFGGVGGHASIELGPVGTASPALGDAVRVELDAGEGSNVVFTGEVESIEQQVRALVVHARDGLARLGEYEVERGYEEVTAGFIVNDLVEAAGAEAGEIEDGPTFPRYIVHGGPRALRHASKLAELVGAELFTDGEGRVCFTRPTDGATDHQLRWGERLLQVQLEREPLRSDSLAVWGEGSAGTDGSDREHWLTTDLSSVAGEASVTDDDTARSVSAGSLGDRPRTLIDGSIRSADTADELANAHMQALALRPIRGSALVLGQSDITPGSWVELVDVPAATSPVGAGRTLRVRVRHFIHHLSPRGGLLTELRF